MTRGAGALSRGVRGAMSFATPDIMQWAAGHRPPGQILESAAIGGLGFGPASKLVGAGLAGVGAAGTQAILHPEEVAAGRLPIVTGIQAMVTVGALRKLESVLTRRRVAKRLDLSPKDQLVIDLARDVQEGSWGEPLALGARKLEAPPKNLEELARNRYAQQVDHIIYKVNEETKAMSLKLERSGRTEELQNLQLVAGDVRAAAQSSEAELVASLRSYDNFMMDADKLVESLPVEYWTGGDAVVRLSAEGEAMLDAGRKVPLGPRTAPALQRLRHRPIPASGPRVDELARAADKGPLFEYLAEMSVGPEGSGRPFTEAFLEEFGYTRKNLPEFIETLWKAKILENKPTPLRGLEGMEDIRGYPQVLSEDVRRVAHAKREQIKNMKASEAKKREYTLQLEDELARLNRAERGKEPLTDTDVGTYDSSMDLKEIEEMGKRNIWEIGAAYAPQAPEYTDGLYVARLMAQKGIFGSWHSKSGKVRWKDPQRPGKFISVLAEELEKFPDAGDSDALGNVVITTKGDKAFYIVQQEKPDGSIEYSAFRKDASSKRGRQKPLTYSQVRDLLMVNKGFVLERLTPDGGYQIRDIISGARRMYDEFQLRKVLAETSLLEDLSPEVTEMLRARGGSMVSPETFSAEGYTFGTTDGPQGAVFLPLRVFTPTKQLFAQYQDALRLPLLDVWNAMEQMGVRPLREWGKSLGPRLRNVLRELKYRNDGAIWEYISTEMGQRSAVAERYGMKRGDVAVATEVEVILREVFGKNYEAMMRDWIPAYSSMVGETTGPFIRRKIQILSYLRGQAPAERVRLAQNYGLTPDAELPAVAEAILLKELGGRAAFGRAQKIRPEEVPDELKVWIDHGLVPETPRLWDFINNAFATKMRLHLSPYWEQMNELKELVRGANLTGSTRTRIIQDISRYQAQIMASVSNDMKTASDFFQVLNTHLGTKISGQLPSWFARHFLLLTYTGTMPLRLGLVLRNMTQTFTTTFLYAGAENYARGFARAFTKEGRQLVRELGLNELTGVPLEEMLARETAPVAGKLRTAYNKGMIAYKGVDAWINRNISANIGYTTIKHYAPKFLKGQITLQEFKDLTGLVYFPKSAQSQVLRKMLPMWEATEAYQIPVVEDVAVGIEKAAKTYALHMAEDTQWIYRVGNSPQIFTSRIGRLFGQFGTWPTNFVRFWLRGARANGVGSKASQNFLARWFLVNEGLHLAGKHLLGIDVRPWILEGPFVFGGGPMAQIFNNVQDLTRGGLQADLAKQDLKRQFRTLVPFGLFIQDVHRALNEEELSEALKRVIGFRTPEE